MHTTSTRHRLLTAALALTLALGVSEAHATKRIYDPYVSQGEMEFEALGSHYYDDDANVDGGEKAKLAVGYGMTDRWFTELYFEVEKDGMSGADYKSTAVEWENRFMLTEPGEYWADVGLYLAYEATLEAQHADKVEGKLLLAKDTGKFTHLANLILESDVGGYANEQLEAGVALGTRYRLSPYFEPGLEWYSEFGPVKSMHASNQFGPAIYGDLPGIPVHYDIGYLFGASRNAPDGELKFILEHEFRF